MATAGSAPRAIAEPDRPQSVFRGLQERYRWVLWGMALSVLTLIAIRSLIQSITIDEADTYVYWISGKVQKPWFPHSNNHLLNTYLIWAFVHLFGLNNVSMRLPSFIGAVLYLSATYRFCVSFVDRFPLRLPLYACFILNPFVLDFFVAARGYGLALGFLTTAIVIMCEGLAERPASRRQLLMRMAVISACLALSFVANFSFAFVISASYCLFLGFWAASQWPYVRDTPTGAAAPLYLQMGAALLPGASIVAALGGWTLLHWPKGQLVVGSSSFAELWNTFLAFTFPELNGRILPPSLINKVMPWGPVLPWALITICVLQIIYLVIRRKQWRNRPSANRAARAGVYLGAVIIITLFMHWLAFRFAGLLMPKGRTSVFLLPLCLMVVGIVANLPHVDTLGRTLQWATVAILFVGSAYFFGCLRVHFFLEWRFNADVEETYRKLVQITGAGRRVDIPSEFEYTSALNYYREYFHDDSFGPFWLYDNPRSAPNTHYKPYPLDQPVYVLAFPQDGEFAAEQHLKVVYRGSVSDVVIAMKPGVGLTTP
jgi:hypothetical protein